eukprot:SAG22_NODE_2778_length_2218_cov_14.689476_2_plen_159_part_00
MQPSKTLRMPASQSPAGFLGQRAVCRCAWCVCRGAAGGVARPFGRQVLLLRRRLPHLQCRCQGTRRHTGPCSGRSARAPRCRPSLRRPGAAEGTRGPSPVSFLARGGAGGAGGGGGGGGAQPSRLRARRVATACASPTVRKQPVMRIVMEDSATIGKL